ncbi:MAG TPA: hypothetical protein VLA43_11765, partial [Longimicrobiales bacterium]|nr:hypothetical protein [Longimicrobiales bacterium]
RLRAAGQGVPAAAAPALSVGADAVHAAEEARRMREARSVQKLADAEVALQSRLDEADASGSLRAVAGRIFREEDGVWTDMSLRPGLERIRVRAFSPAYFQLLDALDELRQVAGALTPVVVAGAEVALEVGEGGVERLSPAELSEAVRRFRGTR